jgi:hypothetical protein
MCKCSSSCSANNCNKNAKSVVFILFIDDPEFTMDVELEKARSVSPVDKFAIDRMDFFDASLTGAELTAELQLKANTLEKLVIKYVKLGFKYVVLPSQSSLLSPYIRGIDISNGTELFSKTDVNAAYNTDIHKGQNINQRFPNTQFLSGNTTTPAVFEVENMTRMGDTITQSLSAIVKLNYETSGLDASNSQKNKIIYLVETADQSGLNSFTKDSTVAKSLGFEINVINVVFNGVGYDPVDPTKISAIAAGQQRVTISLSTSGIAKFTDPLNSMLLSSGVDALVSSDSSLYSYLGINYGQQTIHLNNNVLFTLGGNLAIPSNEIVAAGFSQTITQLAQTSSDGKELNLLDALKFVSLGYTSINRPKTATTAAATGTPWAFDPLYNEMITYWVTPSFLKAGTGKIIGGDTDYTKNIRITV